MQDTAASHVILRLWTRPVSRVAPEEQETLELEAGHGVVGDHTHGGEKHVTLIFADDWNQATAELGREVDPSGRRANVLLSGGDGLRLVGQHVRLGPVLLEIVGETKPCFVMEKAAEGLLEALKPGGRAGVWGRILEGGVVRPSDTLEQV